MNNHKEMSDEKLIQFYLNCNPNELATLVELYKDRIYCSIFIMVQDKYAAEEIFRDVFISIINNLLAGKTPEDGDFLQWATEIAHHLCIEYVRKTNLIIVIPVGCNGMDEAINFSAQVAIPNTNYHESHGKIKSLISMLPDEQREVIALNHYAGLSFKEIAGIMKCSLTSALDTMKHGLNNLCKLMKEKEIVLR